MITGNEPAMPIFSRTNEDGVVGYNAYGLTIRQQFAAIAMQGLMSQDNSDDKFKEGVITIAAISVHMADALIDELNKVKDSWAMRE